MQISVIRDSSKLPSIGVYCCRRCRRLGCPGAPHLSSPGLRRTGRLKPRPPPGFSQTCFEHQLLGLSKLGRSWLYSYSGFVSNNTHINTTNISRNMPSRTAQEWMRVSLRTPGIFIFGLVMAPCGWILNLTATVAPNWRTLHTLPNRPESEIIEQGIWDICRRPTISTSQCGLEDTTYFGNDIIEIAQGLMVASLILTIIGLGVAIPGVRCWRDSPRWILAGLGGLLIFCAGVLTIIPIAWYTHILETVTTVTSTVDVRVGYCIVLGYIGGIFQVLGGFVMFIGICRCCGGKNRGEVRVEEAMAPRFTHQKPPPRRVDVPSLSRPRSSASSVPYSKNSVDDDVSFPRAKSPAARSTNTSYSARPYDVDL